MSKEDSDAKTIHFLDLGEFDCQKTSHHYQVQKGFVDLFLSPKKGREKGRRFLICRLNSGDVIVGLKGAIAKADWELIASGSPDTVLIHSKWNELCQLEKDIEAERGKPSKNCILRWPDYLTGYLNNLKLEDEIDKDVLTQFKKNPTHKNALIVFQTLYPALIKGPKLEMLGEEQHAKAFSEVEDAKFSHSYQEMLGVFGDVPLVHKATSDNAVIPCLQHIADYFELSFPQEEDIQSLYDFSMATGVQFREVSLTGNWWKTAASPILLKMIEDGPVCLALPSSSGSYELLNPIDGSREKLTKALSEKLEHIGWIGYRPLPQKKLRLFKDIVPFSFGGAKPDLLRLFLVGCLAAILSLATPWFTSFIFDYAVPNGEIGQLLQMLLGLVIATFAASFFQLVRAIAIIRLNGKINLNLEIGIWDRLIRLPVYFFKSFTTGELTVRATAASGMRQVMAGVAITSILSGIFSIFSFLLLFYYDAKLALIATAGTLLLCAFTFFVSTRQYAVYRNLQEKVAKLSGMVVQILTGIAKIQGGGKEKMAFSQWADRFVKIKSDAYIADWWNAILSTFNAVWLPLLSLGIFAYISSLGDKLSLGNFLAFNAALGQFTSGLVGLTGAASSILQSLPMLKQMTPIIENLPEVHSGSIDPGELRGKLAADNLSFRYTSDGAEVIQGVSLAVSPGQYVAITGPSGSGKSTLFRLLLGFEKPLKGSIFFDDHDMAQLNPQRVRQQCGVVLQNSLLMPGSLYENIVGSAPLTMEEAMMAATKAGMKEDIEAMPMGMHTMVAERGGTLSGGQRQRVLIARALAKNPKVLFFDEATSALDNKTQSIVIESLEALAVTRIVIAHRLTTIQKADLIIVMDKGKVVQQGDYQTLISTPGLFKQMAERQLAEA